MDEKDLKMQLFPLLSYDYFKVVLSVINNPDHGIHYAKRCQQNNQHIQQHSTIH